MAEKLLLLFLCLSRFVLRVRLDRLRVLVFDHANFGTSPQRTGRFCAIRFRLGGLCVRSRPCWVMAQSHEATLNLVLQISIFKFVLS